MFGDPGGEESAAQQDHHKEMMFYGFILAAAIFFPGCRASMFCVTFSVIMLCVLLCPDGRSPACLLISSLDWCESVRCGLCWPG